MLKPFFVHHNFGPGPISTRFARGFTVHVEEDKDNPRNVVISGTWCNGKDNFVKKLGRETALKGEKVVINKRQLPGMLCKMTTRTPFQVDDGYFDYLYKYML